MPENPVTVFIEPLEHAINLAAIHPKLMERGTYRADAGEVKDRARGCTYFPPQLEERQQLLKPLGGLEVRDMIPSQKGSPQSPAVFAPFSFQSASGFTAGLFWGNISTGPTWRSRLLTDCPIVPPG